MNKAEQLLNVVESNYYSKEMLDVKAARLEDGMAYGYVFIEFREGAAKRSPDGFHAFVLNGGNDGWFRRTEGLAKGYGLAIMNLKVTSWEPLWWGKYKVYKAKMRHIPSHTEGEENAEDGFVWLAVHDKFEVEDVLEYIKRNSDNWRA